MEIKDFWFDLAADTLTLGDQSMRIPPGMLPKADIEGWGFQAASWTLRIRLPGGHEVEAELPRQERAPEDGRALVYLDQNQWSLLSRSNNAPVDGVAAQPRAAATLEALVASRSIVVPASGGNFVETVPLDGPRRIEIAEAMLRVSRGWQMRHPLEVRRAELRATLTNGPAAAEAVFAPGADSAFDYDTPVTDAMKSSDWLGEVMSHVPRILGLYETLVEPVAINEHADFAERLAASWASGFAELSARLAADGASREQAFRAVHANMLLDMRDDIETVATGLGITSEEAITRLCSPNDPLRTAPFLSRLRAWLYARVRNTKQRWESNDLVDGMYLCCAAGYADIVVGEKNAIGYLRQARDVPAGAKLATSLDEAVALLADQL